MCSKKKTFTSRYSNFPNQISSLTNRIYFLLYYLSLLIAFLNHTFISTATTVWRILVLFIQQKDVFVVVCFFVFNLDGNLCHNIVSGTIVLRATSKDDILFVKLCQLSRVSKYGTGITVAYFDRNNEWIFENIGIISSYYLVIYDFSVLWRDIFLFSITILNRTNGPHISVIVLKSLYWIHSLQRLYYWIKYQVLLGYFQN